MGKAEEMAAALKLKQAQEQEGKAQLQAIMDDWPVQIDKLLTTIETWLSPLISSGLTATRSEEIKTESPPGYNFKYKTQKLTIRFGSQTAVVEPFARFMIGMGGRVDYRLGKKDIGIILSTDGTNTWQTFVQTNPPSRPQFVPFNEDFFLDHLAKFLNI